jgi:Predicted Zn-dependent peptidases
MLYTFRVDYRPDLKGADVLKVVDKVISAIQEHGITEDELKQAKVNFRRRSWRISKARPVSAAPTARGARALRRRPEPHQHDPQRPRQGDDDDVQQAAKKYLVPSNRTSDRSAAGRGWQVKLQIVNCKLQIVTALAVLCAAASASAQERPAVGPERPFQLAPRVEKTLPNGLRVIVTRQTPIPKVVDPFDRVVRLLQ